ncbi:hypothetical protein H9Q70_007106 [Fusarium xylarioides]|nr:hypothetical protein H9Q70_007106 [Fusarium xylarioides]KAG5784179.1 hypothetical protein H9Q73_002164 [Fusarium xylarioides]
MFESDQNQNVPQPGQDPAQVRQWMSPRDPSPVSPGILMLLNNQEILAEQLSKLTEVVCDLKIGPRSSSKASSRRSSDASSRRSSKGRTGQEQASDVDMGEHDDTITRSFVDNDDFYHIFEGYIQNSRATPNVKRSRRVLENANKFRAVAEAQLCDFWDLSTLDEIRDRLLSLDDEQVVDLYITLSKRLKDEKSEGKKTALPSHQAKVVQTRTASFRTDIQGLDDGPSAEVDTPRREKRKAPQTPGPRRLMRGRNVVHDSDDEEEEEEEEEEESGITDEGFP